MSDTANNYRSRALIEENATLDAEHERVIAKIDQRLPISRDAADVADQRSTLGDKLADRVAAVGGSWGFIISFAIILVGWMVVNSDILARSGLAFDPYPYIFLNLMLSTLAAIQAPVIMMSQNRQARKDRLAASLDYEVNLRTELEIIGLRERMDLAIDERLERVLKLLEERALDQKKSD